MNLKCEYLGCGKDAVYRADEYGFMTCEFHCRTSIESRIRDTEILAERKNGTLPNPLPEEGFY